MKKRRILILISLLFYLLNGQVTTLHSFEGPTSDGQWPQGSLCSDGLNLYGMTPQGGLNSTGTIFKMDSEGVDYTVIHSFPDNVLEPSSPKGSLIVDNNTLYSMTYFGGDSSAGTVFSIQKDGSNFTILHSFTGATQGGEKPYGSLVMYDSKLYGMTYSGGASDVGTIFSVDLNGNTFSLLHNFADVTTNGRRPTGSLITDGIYLYGMTDQGGTSGQGTIFRIELDGSNFTILHHFLGPGYPDGRYPQGSLILVNSYLYGMTKQGGANDDGIIFRIKTDGSNYSQIHTFNKPNGEQPNGDLVYVNGIFYGLTQKGGVSDKGIVFRINENGTDFNRIFSFSSSGGNYPYDSLVKHGNSLYGITNAGGNSGYGTIFNLLIPCVNGSIIYNSESSKFNFCEDGIWVEK